MGHLPLTASMSPPLVGNGHLAFSKKISPPLLGHGSPSSERCEPSSFARAWSPAIDSVNVSSTGRDFKIFSEENLSGLIHFNFQEVKDSFKLDALNLTIK